MAEVEFGIHVIHACSPVISKVNVELFLRARIFKSSAESGCRKRETDKLFEINRSMIYDYLNVNYLPIKLVGVH